MDTIRGGVAVVFGGHGAAGTEQDETEPRERSDSPVRWFATVNDEDAELVYRTFSPVLFAWIGIAVTGMRTDRSTPPVIVRRMPQSLTLSRLTDSADARDLERSVHSLH